MLSSPPPHVLLVSAPLQGHVNPLLVLGRRLASRGLLVTFSTVPHAGLKFPHGDGASVAVGRGTLRFEHLRGGSLWAPDDPRYGGFGADVMCHLVDAASEALAGLIGRQSAAGRPVSCVVANAFVPWAIRVAGGMGIPQALLWTESCAVLSLFYHHLHSLAEFPSDEAGPDAPVDVPGLPPMVAGDLPSLIHAPEQLVWRQVLVADLRSLRDTVSWLLVNTFDELERPAIQTLRSHLGLAVTPVGPLLETSTEEHHGGGHGHADDCMAWLDAQPQRSVVFAAFGSMMKLGRDAMAELAAGLAATGRPFLLVVRDGNRKLLPADPGGDRRRRQQQGQGGGVVRAGARALARRRRVLRDALWVELGRGGARVGRAGPHLPCLGRPAHQRQVPGGRVGVGVRLPKPIARDALRRCVEEVMSGPKAAAMRARAGKWKDEASAVLATGGSSERGIQDFVDAVLCLHD